MSQARIGQFVVAMFLVAGSEAWAVPVSWNTNSSGNWNVAGNWTPGLPTASDDVTINRPAGNPTVSLVGADSITIRSLTNAESLVTAGGNLTLTNGASTSTGSFDHSGAGNDRGNFTVSGAGTTFTATGAVTLGGNLYTTAGGVMNLTGATSLAGVGNSETQISAVGVGSATNLGNVTTFTGGTSGWRTYVVAQSGGMVNLDSVPSISVGASVFESQVSSTIDLSSLASFTRSPASNAQAGLWARGGTIQTPNLTTANSIYFQVSGAGVLDTADVSSADGCSFYTETGGQLAMPALTSYAGNNLLQGQIWSTGAGSVTDLSNLTSLSGGLNGWRVYVLADTGGLVDLDSVSSLSVGATVFESRAGSTIDLTALTSFTRSPASNAQSGLWARGGTILTPNLTTANSIYFQVSGAGVLDTADVNSANACSFYSDSGGQLTMPALTSYSGSNLLEAQIFATGAGSLTNLGNVTSFSGGTSGWRVLVLADSGGTVNLDSVPSISVGANVFESRTGSTIDLSSLTSFTRTVGNANSGFWARGGTILTPDLTTASNVYFQVTGAGVLDTADVTSADACSFYADSAGTLTMPALASYTGPSNHVPQWQASGAGSVVSLPALTTLNGATGGNYVHVIAQTGGTVHLNALTSIPSGAAQFIASGAGSTINVPLLTNFNATTSGAIVRAQTGGVVNFLSSGTLTLNNVQVEVTSTGAINADVLQFGPSARLIGAGVLHSSVVNSAGQVDPSTGSPGSLEIEGDFSQGAPGHILMQLNGPAPGTQFDVLTIDGDAALAGSLTVTRGGAIPFVPGFHDTFRILSADLVTGYFTDFTVSTTGTPEWVFALYYELDGVDLKVVLGGDANEDGIVNGADFTIWGDHFGDSGVGYNNGDFNSDGTVDGADFTIWGDHFGDTAPAPGPVATPEPASLALAAIAMALILVRPTRRA